MRDMKSACDQLKIKVTEDQLIAGRYLESRGLSFCVHFGTSNVTEKANILFNLECEKALEVGLIQ